MTERLAGWELQWHRAEGDCVRLVLSPPVVRGLATALFAGAAVAVGCGLAGGSERIGMREELAAATAVHRSLDLRREALSERLEQLDERFGADRIRPRANGAAGHRSP